MLNYVEDDGGRRAAGFKGSTGDCVVRAAAIVLDHLCLCDDRQRHYRLVYDEMAKGMKTAGYVASGNAYAQKPKSGRAARNKVNRAGDIQKKVLGSLGFLKVKLPAGPRPTYTEALETYGPCVVSTAKHMAALVDGSLRDTFDGRTYRMLVPYCMDCAPTWYTADLSPGPTGSGSGQDCSVCGVKCDPSVLFDEERERKAMSVWILDGTGQVQEG